MSIHYTTNNIISSFEEEENPMLYYSTHSKTYPSKMHSEIELNTKNSTWEWKISYGNGSQQKFPDELDLQKIQIITKRSFYYDDNIKWHWFKCLYLPSITITFQRPLKKIKASINMIYSEKHNRSIIQKEENLIGQTTHFLKLSNMVSFKQLKFGTTSTKKNGSKFQLKITISSMEHEEIQILSPLIYIKSKKYHRESQEEKLEHAKSLYIQPFHPDKLSKNFAKRSGIENQVYKDLPNDSVGLMNYLKSSYIKNKIKHPLFFVLRFQKSVKLYCNPKIFSSLKDNNEQEIVLKFQSYLNSIDTNILSNKEIINSPDSFQTKEAHFLLFFQDQKEHSSITFTKIVSENLLFLQHKHLQITFHESSIPSNFIMVDHTRLKDAYIHLYKAIKDKDKQLDMISLLKNPEKKDKELANKSSKKSKIALKALRKTKTMLEHRDKLSIQPEESKKIIEFETKCEYEKEAKPYIDSLNQQNTSKYDKIFILYTELLKENQMLKDFIKKILYSNNTKVYQHEYTHQLWPQFQKIPQLNYYVQSGYPLNKFFIAPNYNINNSIHSNLMGHNQICMMNYK